MFKDEDVEQEKVEQEKEEVEQEENMLIKRPEDYSGYNSPPIS